MLTIVAGHDPSQPIGFNLCLFSASRHTSDLLNVVPLLERPLRASGLYRRPHVFRNGLLWCEISDAPMSTPFANSRFLSPWAAGGASTVLYCDFTDMLFRRDPAELFALADSDFAIQVIKRRYEPADIFKMRGQVQTQYTRKNWSSVILWNLEHPAHRRLTLEMVNTLPGRDLHAFCWLKDEEIGELPAAWNHLVGYDDADAEPALLHFTAGTPETGIYAGRWLDVWRDEFTKMDATR